MANLAPKKCRRFFGILTIFSLLFLGGKSQISKNLKILGNRFFSKWRKLVRNDQKQWNMVYKRILKVLFAQIHHMGHFWAEIRTLKFFTRNYDCENRQKWQKIQKNDDTFLGLNQPFLTILMWKKVQKMTFECFTSNVELWSKKSQNPPPKTIFRPQMSIFGHFQKFHLRVFSRNIEVRRNFDRQNSRKKTWECSWPPL